MFALARQSKTDAENANQLRHLVHPECYGTGSTLRRFRLRIDLHGGGHASHQPDAIRHLINVDAHRHALRKTHPGKNRIYRGKSRLIRLRVRDVDAAGDTADMATNRLAVAHQLNCCRVAFMDPSETGLLEVAVDPEGIGVNDGDQLLTDG